MSREDILRLLSSRHWFHSFEIVPGVVTPGGTRVNPKGAMDYLGVPEDLKGQTVLDIGAWDGAYSFELEHRGANVVALDIQDPDRTGFNTAKTILNSTVEYVRGSVYELADRFARPFDLVLFFGVYYHLKSPVLALQQIWQVLAPRGRLFFEGAVLDYADQVDSFWKGRSKLLTQLRSAPVTYFTHGQYASDDSNWFVPTRACLEEWLASAGFVDIKVAQPLDKQHSRAAGSAAKDELFSEYEHRVM